MTRIDFEGSFNFRDLGGLQTTDGRAVRPGRLFRADSVHLMTDDDVDRARDELGIRTMVDLRSEMEITVGGVGALADHVDARYHAPLSSHRATTIDAPIITGAMAAGDRSPDAMVEQYTAMLEASSDLLVEIVGALADADAQPAVFFCAAGKDRTGVLAATVLGALEVRDEDIVADYVETEKTVAQVIGRFAQNPGAPALYREKPASYFAPYAETMERVIAYIEEHYGTFAQYLLDKGLPPEKLDALRTSLLA